MAQNCDFIATKPEDPIREISSPIIARHERTGEIYACGTATVIGRGIAITASHVIFDILDHFNTKIDQQSKSQNDFQLLMYLDLNGGKELLPLKVAKTCPSTTFDIAILHFVTPEDWDQDNQHVWKAPKIQLLPTMIGKSIFGFGFSMPLVTQDEPDTPEIEYKSRTTTGHVIDIHHELRDSAKLPFPCFQVNARFDGSMSGGPVFNSDGNLCGIVCSSIPADEEFSEHVSYVSTLWPMLGLTVQIEDPTNTGKFIDYLFSDYFDSGQLFAVDRAFVSVEKIDGGPAKVSCRYDKSTLQGIA